MKQTTIRSDLLTIGSALTVDFRYHVPQYQRNFSWTEDEVQQLWNDLVDAIDEDRAEYFLGSIVVHEIREDKLRIVIDGQQRLACLSMILSAIRTVYRENSDDRDQEVFGDYLGVKDRRTRTVEPRMKLNVLNEPVFQECGG
jgi:uncharacterized protein with ParB-like and HNH nuclease domain